MSESTNWTGVAFACVLVFGSEVDATAVHLPGYPENSGYALLGASTVNGPPGAMCNEYAVRVIPGFVKDQYYYAPSEADLLTSLQVDAGGRPQSPNPFLTSFIVGVAADGYCDYSIVGPSAPWIHGPASQQVHPTGGPGVFHNLTFDPNPSHLPRSGTISFAGIVISITQAGAATPCTYGLVEASRTALAIAGTGLVALTTSGTGTCAPWTAVSDSEQPAWLHVTSSASGTGAATIAYAYDANTTAQARTGHITVAGQTFTLTQDASRRRLELQWPPTTGTPWLVDIRSPRDVLLKVQCTGVDQQPTTCAWKVGLSVWPGDADAGGHEVVIGMHGQASRPIGLLFPDGPSIPGSHEINSNQTVGDAFTYRPSVPIVAGRVTLTATCLDPLCDGDEEKLDVRIPAGALQELLDSDDLVVVGKKPEHIHNQFGIPAFLAQLREAAASFRRARLALWLTDPLSHEQPGRLRFTDLSLPWGGVYDVEGTACFAKDAGGRCIAEASSPAGDWQPPHAEHHLGNAADIGIYEWNWAARLSLRHAFQSAGVCFPVGYESPDARKATHWHAVASTDRPCSILSTVIAAPLVSLADATYCPQPNGVSPDVTVSVDPNPGGPRFSYTYVVANSALATQDLTSFTVEVTGPIASADAPSGWDAAITTTAGVTRVVWFAAVPDPAAPDIGGIPPALAQVKPGASLGGFVLRSEAPPGAAAYEARGYVPMLIAADHAAADELLEACTGLDTPVTGRTTGPVVPLAAYLAEGATSTAFDTRIALLNPGTTATTATLTVSRVGAGPVVTVVDVPARTRVTVDPKDIAGMATAEFSTKIESDQRLVIDRTMSWDARGYGAHAETSVAAPALTWYLAEGATHSGFNLFYLLQNPNALESQVRVQFLRPSGAPLEKTYVLPPTSRTNIWVNVEDFPGLGQALASTDVSAVLESTNGQPIIVERALYLDRAGQVFSAGHESAGVTAPTTDWFLAEGNTGNYFDLFVLIANPGSSAAEVEATYLLPDGSSVTKAYSVAPASRFNIWVDGEDARLADTAVSTTIRSTNGVPVIVERALWWPGGYAEWYESHNSPGATSTGTKWALAEGEVGGSRGVDTYVLLANTSSGTGQVKVTLLFEDGTHAERVFTVAGQSRFNVDVRADFPGAVDKRFGAIVESLGATPAQIVVERAMYWDALGQSWAAGTNSLATKLQ